MPETSCNLSSCFLCKNCLPEWTDLVAVKKKTMLVNKGRKLFGEGEKVHGMYFVFSGVFKIAMRWDDEKELILRFAKPGDMLGHRGFGGDKLYPVSASAITLSKVCFIDNDFLQATLKTNIQFTNQMLHVYADELHNAEKKMRDIAHRDVRGRIIQVLLELSDSFGTDENNFIALPVTRQDIASYAGTTYETVFKILSELTQSGIILSEGKKISIKDTHRLEKLLT
ncbi:MAG: Crp/Fnr family transcriptional regulator [Flavisolibacter sp.]|jgi:CRP-like cAMP-binding protein